MDVSVIAWHYSMLTLTRLHGSERVYTMILQTLGKKTQKETTNTMVRPSQKRYIKKRMILGEGKRNAGLDSRDSCKFLRKSRPTKVETT
jgi:hypothetical protein